MEKYQDEDLNEVDEKVRRYIIGPIRSINNNAKLFHLLRLIKLIVRLSLSEYSYEGSLELGRSEIAIF